MAILAHGYIDPAIYTTGRGMMREQDYLAREGFAVLHVDYRNHASSDDDPTAERDLRLGYTEDVINAVHAVRRSDDPRLDGERVGLVGRSMGGGVVQNVLVTQPGLVDAAVVFASVSSDTVDNYERWIANDRPEVAARIVRAHGTPEENPTFWAQASPRTYVDRATEPLLILHGTADDTCPPRWARQTAAAFEGAGKAVRLVWFEGKGTPSDRSGRRRCGRPCGSCEPRRPSSRASRSALPHGPSPWRPRPRGPSAAPASPGLRGGAA